MKDRILEEMYNEIPKSTFIAETVDNLVEKTIRDMAKNQERHIVEICRKWDINPNIVIEQQSEINRLRHFIEKQLGMEDWKQFQETYGPQGFHNSRQFETDKSAFINLILDKVIKEIEVCAKSVAGPRVVVSDYNSKILAYIEKVRLEMHEGLR